MRNYPKISFVIPAKDEEKNVSILHGKIVEVCKDVANDYEIIFIDDGSKDKTFEELKKIKKNDSRTKIIRLRGWFGKSIALQTGFENTSGEIIITLDADLQDDPKEIPSFLKKLEEGYDLVSGWKKIRHDPLSKTLPSKMGNIMARLLTGIKIHDLNCGFKAYRKEVTNNLHLYGELYKYIPILAAKQNFKVGEIIISHKPRKFGKSKFGWERNIKGFLDMLTVVFLTNYMRRPAHFFGTFGIISFLIGFAIGIYITFLRITTGGIQYRYPLLIMGILLIIVGIQFISTGLIAELITYFSQRKIFTENIIKEKL